MTLKLKWCYVCDTCGAVVEAQPEPPSTVTADTERPVVPLDWETERRRWWAQPQLVVNLDKHFCSPKCHAAWVQQQKETSDD